VQDWVSPSPATIRSKIMLETISEMVADREFWYQQVLVKIRHQGEQEWAFTFAGSDSASVVHEVARREVDFAAINPSTALTMAFLGKGPFAQPMPVRTVTVIPSRDWFGFAVTEASGITSLADVKARQYPLRVSLRGQMDHTVHVYTDAVFNAYGFSRDDILRWGGSISYDPYLPYRDERIGKVKSGEVEAVFDESVRQFIPKAIPLGMRFLSLDEPVLQAIEKLGFRRSVMPKSRFPDLPADVLTIDYSGWPIYTHADVPDDLVYAYCRAMDARKDRIPWQQPGPLPLDRMCRDTPEGPLDVPLHPGAERYWREVGYLA
jgi:TRAP-type uncharacterized transport system substrate-binding protein